MPVESAAAVPSSAGGAPPSANPPPSQDGGNRSGGGGGAAASSSSAQKSGVGDGGAPPVPSGPRYLEREVNRDGKTVKERVKEEALWSAHSREGALNKKIQELVEKEKAAAAKEAQWNAEREKYKAFTPREWARQQQGQDAVDLLARELEEVMKEEQQRADPRMRPLLEAARENKQLKAQLEGIQTREQRQEAVRVLEAELEQMASEFVPALKTMKLPRNDITMGLMADARETAKANGLPLDAATLAQETHKAATGLIEGMIDGVEDDEEVVDMFPKLARRIHAGLLARHRRLAGNNQVQRVAPPKPEDRKTPEHEQPKQRVMQSKAEEHRAYFGDKRVLNTGI